MHVVNNGSYNIVNNLKPGFCLAGNTAASQSEAMFQNTCEFMLRWPPDP